MLTKIHQWFWIYTSEPSNLGKNVFLLVARWWIFPLLLGSEVEIQKSLWWPPLNPTIHAKLQIVSISRFGWRGGGAHLLQFKVSLTHSTQDILETQRAVVDMLAKLRNLATHMHCSLQSSKEFHDMQTESTPLCLVQDVKIRWNSTYLMVKRAWTVKQYIQRFLAEKAILTITPNEYTLMEALLSLLEPIFQLTQMLSSNVSSVSIVIPSIQAIVVRM